MSQKNCCKCGVKPRNKTAPYCVECSKEYQELQKYKRAFQRRKRAHDNRTLKNRYYRCPKCYTRSIYAKSKIGNDCLPVICDGLDENGKYCGHVTQYAESGKLLKRNGIQIDPWAYENMSTIERYNNIEDYFHKILESPNGSEYWTGELEKYRKARQEIKERGCEPEEVLQYVD